MRHAIFTLLATLCAAQPAFDAATIKPSKDTPGHRGWHSTTGAVLLTGQTLKSLTAIAYGVQDYQVFGGPKWADSDRFDINAKSAGPAGDPELLLMLRTLLTERFQLAFHHEQKIEPAYALVAAKSGLKIAPVEATGSKSQSSRAKIFAQGISMAKFAEILARRVNAPVNDLTNAPGVYNIDLEWSLDGDDNDRLSAIFDALQRNLGLKLESRKLPVDVLVIDKAEKPSDN